ncbi:MAG: RidA family protein [bacterium]|nr:RidA family protein [bacterium]
MKKVYIPSDTTNAPLSGAVEINGLVYVSGQIHIKDGKLEGTTIEEKLEITIQNIKNVLKEAGLTLENVIRVQLYLTDLTQLPALNKVYPNYFSHPLPARTAIGVTALPLGANLEIDVIASRNN